MKFRAHLSRYFSNLFLEFRIPIVKKSVQLSAKLYNSPESIAYGLGSRCKDGKYVGFGDYDNLEYDLVLDEVLTIMKKFSLKNVFLFQTKKEGYHFICLEKKSLGDWFHILRDESSCDVAFIYSVKNFKGREWVLRYSEKGGREPPTYIQH
ncbi:hypothetical protein LCGC14_3113940, partial [marine sediment metagenome]